MPAFGPAEGRPKTTKNGYDAPMRAAVVGLFAALWLTSLSSAQSVNAKTVLAEARAYLAQWEPALAAVVAEEHFRQELTEWTDNVGRQTTRQLVSDVLFVRAPNDPVWMLFRDVFTVDDEPVRDRQSRFDALFVRPGDVVPGARRIAEESARYNLGHLARDLNTPAAALLFLKSPFTESTAWKKPTTVDIDGARTWELRFEQSRAPYAIRTISGVPQPAQGRIWIEPGSGRVVRTELGVWTVSGKTTRRPPRAWVEVISHYGSAPGMDVSVPLRMEERYRIYNSSNRVVERVDGEAAYTNHRRFQTGARIIG